MTQICRYNLIESDGSKYCLVDAVVDAHVSNQRGEPSSELEGSFVLNFPLLISGMVGATAFFFIAITGSQERILGRSWSGTQNIPKPRLHAIYDGGRTGRMLRGRRGW